MSDREQDEHRWEMKGVGRGGGGNTTVVGFQCVECGKAKIEQYKSNKEGVIYDGYFESPEQTGSDN